MPTLNEAAGLAATLQALTPLLARGAQLVLANGRVVEIDAQTAIHLKGVQPGINLPLLCLVLCNSRPKTASEIGCKGLAMSVLSSIGAALTATVFAERRLCHCILPAPMDLQREGRPVPPSRLSRTT